MQLCSRCHKRMAVIFVTKIENGETKNEGLCLKCAKEIGIPQVNNIIQKLGISDEDLESMEDSMGEVLADSANGDDNEDSPHAPSLDIGKILSQMNFGPVGNPNPIPNPNGLPNGQNNPNRNNGLGRNGKNYVDQKKEKRPIMRKFVPMYCRDLSQAAKEGKLDPVIGREKEITRTMQILTRRQKNNPCLIGEAGVGKTAIAEGLAQRIADGSVPFKLKDKEVHLLDLTALVAGTQFRGQFESRIKGLIEEVKALGNIILVIDEVHSIVGVGDSEGSMNAANILKPALSRGEIQIIGTTTLAEYRKYIEKDTALERRFQPIYVEEPSIDTAKQMLEGIKKYYEEYHRIHISEEIVDRAVELSERYITDRYLPDKAIDLLDEAASYVALNSPVLSRVAEVEKKLEELKSKEKELEEKQPSKDEKEEDINKRYAEVAEIKSETLKNEEEYEKLKVEMSTIELSMDALAHVIEVWTGVPAGSITENEFERLNGLSDRLKARIIGQDKAVDAVVRAIKRSRAGVSYKRKPASFIFAGPTGIGKTELVKVLANDLFNSPESMIRLDMSEYMEKHTVSKLIGSPPGYVGYDDAGQLTEKIRRRPYSVVLFDEIEKAHPDVLNILLQILDDGRVTDARGVEVKFDNCIIVMTTNAGSSTGMNTTGFGATTDQISENRTEKALLDFLRPEFINRVDEIITFRSLDKEDFKKIALIMMGDLKTALESKGLTITWTDKAIECIAEKSFSVKFGARNMRRYITKNIEDVAAEKLIAGYSKKLKKVTVDSDGENMIVDVK
ncbi:MAG: AAA family ATPase [Clostridiales bacterium]|nr:AAA family ATPase [Clostridiales bacterium]